MIDELWQRYLSPLLKDLSAQPNLLSPEELTAAYLAWQQIVPLLPVLPTERCQPSDSLQIEKLLRAWNAHNQQQPVDVRLAQWWLGAYARGLAAGLADQDLPAPVFDALAPNPFATQSADWPAFWPLLLRAIASGDAMQPKQRPTSQSPLESLNQDYQDWKQWFPTRAASELQLHFYYYLGALALQQYQRADLAQRIRLRPFLIPCLRVLCSEHIADQMVLLKLSQTHRIDAWQALNSLIQTWYRLLHESTQLAQQRDVIFHKLNDQPLEQVLSQQLSHYLHQWGQRTQQHLACLTPLVKQGSQAGYVALTTEADPVADTATHALPRYCFAQENQSRPTWKPLAKLGRATANAASLRRGHLHHQQALEAFWQAPPQQVFQRQGNTLFFETHWFSEAQILLFDLMQALLGLRDLPAEQQATQWQAQLQARQLLPSKGAPLRWDALIDACERILCPARTSNQDQQCHPLILAWAGSGWQHLQTEPTPAAWQRWREAALQALTEWESAHGQWSLEAFNAACPLPAYLYSRNFPLDAERLSVHFVHPMVYTDTPEALPAAMLTGSFYDLNVSAQGQSYALPFVASLWKLHLPGLAPMARFLIDLQVQRAQRQAEQLHFEQVQARRELEMQARRQAEQVTEYEQVRKRLAEIRQLRKSQDQAWERLQETIERPELARLGLSSQQALQAVMHNDFVDGQLVGRHRPGQLEQAKDLDQIFTYLGRQEPGSPVSEGHFISQLQRFWQSQPPDLATARQIFAWLKVVCYDACRPGSLQLGAFLQSLWLIQAQRAQHSHERQQDSRLSCLGWTLADQFDLEPLLQAGMPGFLQRSDWQMQLFSQPLSAPDLDTRRLSANLSLPETLTPMRWLAAFERLCARHMVENLGDRVRLETLLWGIFDAPQAHWIIELRCQGSLSEAAHQHIQRQWQDPSGDFSRDLKTLYRLNEVAQPASQIQEAAFEIQTCSDSASLGRFLRLGIQAFELDGHLHWVICLSQPTASTERPIDWEQAYQQLQATLINSLEPDAACF